jgi:hypothetical protein
MAKQVWCLYFNSKTSCEIYKRDVKDGKVVIKDKEFIVGDAKPFSLKTFFGNVDLYLLRWDSPYPISPEGFEIYNFEITPEMLKRIVELKILNFLIKRIKGPEGIEQNIFPLIFGLAAGALILYILIKMHIIVV